MQLALLRATGALAMWTGYGCSRIRWNISALRAACFQARGWRSLSLGAIAIRVPERWGPVEVGDDGGLVIHNRPAWLRVDGDAVWYGSAIELRVYSSAHPPPVCVAPMRETRRTLKTDSETITLVLRIANGVECKQFEIARRVLHGARLTGSREQVDWIDYGGRRVRARGGGDQLLRHSPTHRSRVARDLERHLLQPHTPTQEGFQND